VDPTQLSLLTADPNITLPYDTMRGFDMEERDIPDLFRTPAGAAPAKDIHILVGVGRVRQEEDIPANIPHVQFDYLHPVYATISRHQHEGRRPIVLRILHITAVGDRLTMSRTSGGPYETEDCVFLRRIHQARENAEDAGEELWKWVDGKMKLYWAMGRERDGGGGRR
jgi:hypothetical protein